MNSLEIALTTTDLVPLFCWPDPEPRSRNDVLGAIRTATYFGRACSQMHKTVSSEDFWKRLANKIAEKIQFFFDDVMDSPWKGFVKHQYSLNFHWLNNQPSLKKEEINVGGMWAFPIQCQEEIQFISFDDLHPLQIYSAKQNSIAYPLILPELEKLSFKQPFWCVTRSDDFIAVNGGGTPEVFIFSGSDYKFLSTYKFQGNVIQLEIHDDDLYIIGSQKIGILNLKDLNKEPNEIFIPIEIGFNVCNFCFGKTHLLLIKKDKLIAASYKDLKEFVCAAERPFPWKEEFYSESTHFFSEGNHFIGVSCHKEDQTFSITKVQIVDKSICTQLIAEKIKILDPNTRFCDLFYSKGRLFITYKERYDQKMTYFDIETKSNHLIDFKLPQKICNTIIPSIFICTTALKIHYLCPKLSPTSNTSRSNLEHFILSIDFEKKNEVQNEPQMNSGYFQDFVNYFKF